MDKAIKTKSMKPIKKQPITNVINDYTTTYTSPWTGLEVLGGKASSGALTEDMFDNMFKVVEPTKAEKKVTKKKNVASKAKMVGLSGLQTSTKTLTIKNFPLKKKAGLVDKMEDDGFGDSSLKKPPKIEVKDRVRRNFKLSDFKFPPVERINSRLACKTLQTDLEKDVLKDIINLDIDMKII